MPSPPLVLVVGGIADSVGEKDELFRVRGSEHQIRGIFPDHAQSVDQCSGEDVGFLEALAIGARNQSFVCQRGKEI